MARYDQEISMPNYYHLRFEVGGSTDPESQPQTKSKMKTNL